MWGQNTSVRRWEVFGNTPSPADGCSTDDAAEHHP